MAQRYNLFIVFYLFAVFAGIHYIGQMSKQTRSRMLLDQLTRGQLDWARIDDQFDTVSTF